MTTATHTQAPKGPSASAAPRLLAPPKGLKDLGDKLVYALLRAVAFPVQLLPYGLVRRIGQAAGLSTFWLQPGRRRVGRTNLDIAFGDTKSSAEKDRLLKASLANAGEVFAASLWSSRVTEENAGRLVSFPDAARMQELGRSGKGLVVVTLHIGNWELMAATVGFLALPIHFVVHRIQNPYLNAFVTAQRARSGNGSVFHDDAARSILRLLKGGEIITIVLDQNMRPGRGGIFAELFGIPAATTRSAGALAITSGSPIHVAYSVPTGRAWPFHEVHFGPEVSIERTGDKQRDVQAATEACNRALEEVIRRHPEHWLWTHRRFKTRPEGHPAVYA